MALIGRTTEREVPHEPGEKFTFRYLSGMEIDEAESLGTEKAIRLVTDLKPEMLQTFMDRGAESGKGGAPKQNNLDAGYVLAKAITDWTYDVPCTPENIAKLDAVTHQWALSVVYEMNTRTPGEAIGSDA